MQRVVVVQRDEIEDQVFDRRRIGPGDRLGAAGALLERQPDHRLAPGVGNALGDRRGRGGRQCHDRGRVGCVFQERCGAIRHVPSASHPVFFCQTSVVSSSSRRRLAAASISTGCVIRISGMRQTAISSLAILSPAPRWRIHQTPGNDGFPDFGFAGHVQFGLDFAAAQHVFQLTAVGVAQRQAAQSRWNLPRR